MTEEAWLTDHRPDMALALGRYFKGGETDWAALRSAVEWTGRLLECYPDEVPPEIARLVLNPTRLLEPLRKQYSQLSTTWQRWQKSVAALDGLLDVPALLSSASTTDNLDTADFARLESALARLHDDLDAYWSALDTIAAHRTQPPETLHHQDICRDLESAREAYQLQTALQAQDAQLTGILEHFYAGLETDWHAVHEALNWCETFLATYPEQTPPERVCLLASPAGDAQERTMLNGLAVETRHHINVFQQDMPFAVSILPLETLLQPATALAQADVGEMRATFAFYLDNLDKLERWLGCEQQQRLCAALGLGSLLDVALRLPHFPENIVACFEKRFYQLWLDKVMPHTPALANFQGADHQAIIERFRELDAGHSRLAQQRLVEQLRTERRRIVATLQSGSSQGSERLRSAWDALARELAKKRNKSIRNIVQASAPAIVALEPCWMMSPLSVSQYIESGQQLFDLVIFDEASQVCPEDAICAILRGKQLIVVGDSKQLPPTNFFTKTLADSSDDDDEDESEDAVKQAESERTESILEECGVIFPKRALSWHYRSQHESLIAFSNAHFYEGRLSTFPAPWANHSDGVRFDYVANGIYERGGARRNLPEAEHAVDLIHDYLQQHGTIATLGVIALSEAQQSAIRDVIERRLKIDALFQAYVNELDEPDGGFFVKNLESVQGDERDTIILSIGYGRDATGKMTMNFGPVNKPGGERRLNVAVTRARKQLILVTSLHAGDLSKSLANKGAQTLGDYLDYAEHGPSVLAEQIKNANLRAVDGELRFDSPFEESVYQALQAHGMQLATQVGCSGYRIDLAVRDPHNPTRYLLGIECDGATYHSSATARDRDRLRQRQLETMGWRIIRIWSRDWVRNPMQQVQRVLDAIAEAEKKEAGMNDVAPVTSSTPTAPDTGSAPTATIAPTAAQDRNTPIKSASGDIAEEAAQNAATRPASILVSKPVQASRNSHQDSRELSVTQIVQPQRQYCENCAFYQMDSQTRYYCGRLAARRNRHPSGRTPACEYWRKQQTR